MCSVFWLFLLGCQYRCKWLTGKTRLQNDPYCVDGDVKPYSLAGSKWWWWLFPSRPEFEFLMATASQNCCSASERVTIYTWIRVNHWHLGSALGHRTGVRGQALKYVFWLSLFSSNSDWHCCLTCEGCPTGGVRLCKKHASNGCVRFGQWYCQASCWRQGLLTCGIV